MQSFTPLCWAVVTIALFSVRCSLPKNNSTSKNRFEVTPLAITTPYNDVSLGEIYIGKTKVGFDIKGNYQLGATTPDATRDVPVAESGQQLFVRFNNEQPVLYTENSFQKIFKDGEVTVFAILLRSNYESIKNGKAHFLARLTLQNRAIVKQTPVTEPTIILISPFETVKGNTVLLDYFVANAPAGSTVLLDIDGEKHTLNDFQARRISGLNAGEHTLRLLLLDAQRKPLAPSIVRKIKVTTS